MNEPFTGLEVQLIRSSLATKTDAEIAELLERSVQEITDMINELTGGCAQTRVEQIARRREEVEKQSRDRILTMQLEAKARREANEQAKVDARKARDEARQQEMRLRREEREQRKAERLTSTGRRKKQVDLAESDRAERRRREAKKIADTNEALRVASRRREDRRRFETRPVDLSKKISVKIDEKTYVFVDPGTDIEKIKKQYYRKPLVPDYLK